MMSLPFIIFPLPGSMSTIFPKQVLDWREGEARGKWYVRLWLRDSLSKIKRTSNFKRIIRLSLMFKGSAGGGKLYLLIKYQTNSH